MNFENNKTYHHKHNRKVNGKYCSSIFLFSDNTFYKLNPTGKFIIATVELDEEELNNLVEEE